MMKKFALVFVLFLIIITPAIEAKTSFWNKGRGYQPFSYATPDGILMHNLSDTLKFDYFKLPDSTSEFSLSFRAKNITGNPQKKYHYYNRRGDRITVDRPHWGFFLTCENDTIVFSVQRGDLKTALEPIPSLQIKIHYLAEAYNKQITLTEKINPYDGENLWKITCENSELRISAGDKDLNPILETPFTQSITGFGFFAGWGDKILISDVALEYSDAEEYLSCNGISPNDVDQYLCDSVDEMEGYWIIFDRELEESLLKPGGQYSLLCLRNGVGYSFFYIEGATVNAGNWKPGDLKIQISPTPFPDIFYVIWVDAMKESMSHDIKAQKGDGNSLTIQFPYQSSKIRLRKIPK